VQTRKRISDVLDELWLWGFFFYRNNFLLCKNKNKKVAPSFPIFKCGNLLGTGALMNGS
jgi:hypothetical protein